jgi:formylglycine-generating enzyme required for sulfatase activity
MVALEGGTFLMGSPEGEAGRSDDEGPQHEVTVAGFAIGRYPVTFAEYDHFCDATGREKPEDKGWGRGRMPVISVSWRDAVAYTAWLAEQTGKRYRLPSEAEWEYACRAGTQTAYWWGDAFDSKKANTLEGGTARTTEVGSYPANPWGLFDTLGNVWEWVEDHYHENYMGAPSAGRAWVDATAENDRPRVLRGGSWVDDRHLARCADRLSDSPLDRDVGFGFRVVCSSPIVPADP